MLTYSLVVKQNLGLDAKKPVFVVCEQHRRRPACAFAQSDQLLCDSLFEKYHMLTCYRRNFNLLASLCSWGHWFETRFVDNPEDRFCRDEAQMAYFSCVKSSNRDRRGVVCDALQTVYSLSQHIDTRSAADLTFYWIPKNQWGPA